MDKDTILKMLKEQKVAYLRLWFTDILGQNKNVEVPSSQFAKALDGQILFDGSSIEGFSRIEESDMILVPDYNSFIIFPWDTYGGKVARLICDIHNPDGTPFAGCPRTILKNVCHEAKSMGYIMNAGPEAEFFLLEKNDAGEIQAKSHDAGSYFDLTPLDKGEDARRAIVQALESIGFEVEAAHHEVAMGQHEIDFKYADAVTTADNIATFKFIVRKIALDFGLHATFMPKPIYGINGSGMHTHQSLFDLDGNNVFYDKNAKWQISKIGLQYIGGLLTHARAFTAITNPLINSYKRLVPGFEAPTHLAWSEQNRSPLIRVPARHGIGTRAELRSPDPACNPYLALAATLAAGLDGIKNHANPGEPVNRNIYRMSQRERAKLKIKSLPSNLQEAINLMERSKLMRQTLGEHTFHNYVSAKQDEWNRYIKQVHPCELDWYLTRY
ncbi:MAG: type I glutamate--ammonia ligase [Gammaproteobacteria bacterium]|nr:type I glutamate--ammonia ligase [Gammaproteobacteria bacterium]